MRRLQLFIGAAAVMVLSPVSMVSAQLVGGGNLGGVQTLMTTIINVVNSVIIPFIIGIGFLVFVWGMFKFFIVGGSNDEAKEQGKSLMIYATLGFVLIIVFWGIINLLTSSTGLQGKQINNMPKANAIPAP